MQDISVNQKIFAKPNAVLKAGGKKSVKPSNTQKKKNSKHEPQKEVNPKPNFFQKIKKFFQNIFSRLPFVSKKNNKEMSFTEVKAPGSAKSSASSFACGVVLIDDDLDRHKDLHKHHDNQNDHNSHDISDHHIGAGQHHADIGHSFDSGGHFGGHACGHGCGH